MTGKTESEKLDEFRTTVITSVAGMMRVRSGEQAQTAVMIAASVVSAARHYLLGQDVDEAFHAELEVLTEMGLLPPGAATMFRAGVEVERLFVEAFGHGH